MRQILIVGLTVALLAAPLAVEAQQPTKVPRVGILWPVADDPVLDPLGPVPGR